MKESLAALRSLAHPERARVVAHLHEHKGDTARELSDHLEIPLSTVYRYLAELEPTALVQTQEDAAEKHYYVPWFEFAVDPVALRQWIETPLNLVHDYEKALGKRRWARVLNAMEKVRQGEITVRGAARRSGLPYYEFTSLLDAFGLLSENSEPSPQR